MPRRNSITSVITGDIVNSRMAQNNREWLKVLKRILTKQGNAPRVWEIFRGDSFQVEVKKPELALWLALQLKANIKMIRGLDVRMAIGVGLKHYDADRVSESNGEAFVYSGEKLEALKKEKLLLAIKTPSEAFNEEFNLYLRLAAFVIDGWTQSSAEIVKTLIEKPGVTQRVLSQKLGIAQSSVSERLKRAGYNELLLLNNRYQTQLSHLIHNKFVS